MRSLSPSKIFVCTSTVSPIANSGTSDLRLVFSTFSIICCLMIYSFSYPRRYLNTHNDHKPNQQFFVSFVTFVVFFSHTRPPFDRLITEQIGPSLACSVK